jgi:uncharacterized YigZ family protein
MSPSFYPTPANATEVKTEVKKSRFIARAARASDRQEALAFVEQSKREFPDARHHCWAYLLGNPASAATAAMNDDGEPSGTAGRPILNVIQHKGIGDVVVVVVRYFGGIKLGAGGLVRAYSAAAESAMSILPLEHAIAMQQIRLKMGFAKEQLLRHWLHQNQGEVVAVDYGVHVTVEVSVPLTKVEELTTFCAAQGVNFDVKEKVRNEGAKPL